MLFKINLFPQRTECFKINLLPQRTDIAKLFTEKIAMSTENGPY